MTDYSDSSDTLSSDSIYDEFPVIPSPLAIQDFPINDNRPGKIKLNEKNQLVKKSFVFSGMFDDLVEGYNYAISYEIPEMIKYPLYDDKFYSIYLDNIKFHN